MCWLVAPARFSIVARHLIAVIFTVGCIVLSQPFFLPEDLWIPVPSDWSPNIVQGRTYDLTARSGAKLLRQLQEALAGLAAGESEPPRYGLDVIMKPRLGQGGFRLPVTDAYERRCAVSGERVLPVLEAAHVRPYYKGGEHSLDNAQQGSDSVANSIWVTEGQLKIVNPPSVADPDFLPHPKCKPKIPEAVPAAT